MSTSEILAGNYSSLFESDLKQTIESRIAYYCDAWKKADNLVSMVETVKEGHFYFVSIKCLPVENNGYKVQRYILLTVKEGTTKPIFETSNVIDDHYTKTAEDTKKLTLNYFNHITNQLNRL